MYKYKAKLLANQEIIAQANDIDELEGMVLSFRRKQKYGEHTLANEKVEIIHVLRDNLKGQHKSKEEVIKTI
ncbi:MAG6790 family protein [Mycoplasmopsis opalescens]|uniref:MAG6790 family protein n=1 Tax=Mycoplasmopsis opalescens TaxID=114886 RepID=UPI0004A7470B|nr:hypothetical protein [Mycoplasmopsis opalescens]